jgi:His-Xaa-Ser system protein HxsD
MPPTGISPAEPQPAAVTLGGPGVAVEVDLTVYSLHAVFRACYKYTDRLYVFLARSSKQCLIVTLHPKVPEQEIAQVAGEFANELVDQQLRGDLTLEAAPLREMIVAQAFAEGNLLDEARDEGDYRNDPAGIGRRR